MKTQKVAPSKYWLWAYQKVIFSYMPLMAIEELLQNQSQESAWQYVAEAFNWKEVPDVFLRAIALKVYNSEYGHHILLPILKSKALHLEDFEIMAKDWTNPNKVVQWEVTISIYDAASYAGRCHEGSQIAQKIRKDNAEDYCLTSKDEDSYEAFIERLVSKCG